MVDLTNVAGNTIVSEQAIELSLLNDLEARWENLRTTSSLTQAAPPSTQNLHDKQRAYEAFSVKMTAYNKKYAPPHVPELLLNRPSRLGIWCRSIRKLYMQVEHDPRSHCPTHVLEKAHRWADRVADIKKVPRFNRSIQPDTIGAVLRDLEALCQWCDALDQATPIAGQGQ